MSKENKINRKIETVISLMVLAALAAVIVTIVYVQADFDMNRFGIKADGEEFGEASEAEAVFELGEKFTQMSPPERYSEDSLYEKINGKAPLYTSAGFNKLTTQRYSLSSSPDLWIEVYRYQMQTPKAAFYVYSTQKRGSATPLEGFSPDYFYKTSSGIYAVIGSYYWEITSSAEDNDLLETIQDSLPSLTGSDDGDFFEAPSILPDENAVEGSLTLYLDSAFGIGGLGEVYIRDYEFDGKRLKAFAVINGKNAEDEFQSFMQENTAEMVNDADGIKTYDLFGVYELITRHNGLLIGIHETDHPEVAREFIKSFISE